MAYSAFSRFGHVGFSSKELPGRKFYLALRKSLGPHFDQSFNDNPIQARLYAQAMALARAVLLLQRVKNNAIALKATDLLPALETIFGLIPGPKDTENQRRRKLHARMQVSRGARREAILEILEAHAGADFIDWVYATATTLVRLPDIPSVAARLGNDVPPGTAARVFRVTAPVSPGAGQTIAVEEITENVGSESLVGIGFVIDPSFIGRAEHSTVESFTVDGSGNVVSIVADMTYPHAAGSFLTTQHFPAWRSNANDHRFILEENAALDLETRRHLDGDLSRAMRAVSTWSLTSNVNFTVGEGHIGVSPITTSEYFTVGLGLIGITPIGP